MSLVGVHEPEVRPSRRAAAPRRGAVMQMVQPDEEAIRRRDEERLEDYRMRATAFARLPRDEDAIDNALSQSFPASDPPPWTLGVVRDDLGVPDPSPRGGRAAAVSGSRAGSPTWVQGILSLVEGSAVVALFALAILLIGSVLALGVRLLLAALTAATSWLFPTAGP